MIVLLEGEEEIGSPHIAAFVRDHADRLKADLVITADGPLHESRQADRAVRRARRRLLRAARQDRRERDAHSGNFGGVVPNAIWTLVHLLAR